MATTARGKANKLMERLEARGFYVTRMGWRSGPGYKAQLTVRVLNDPRPVRLSAVVTVEEGTTAEQLSALEDFVIEKFA